MIMYVPNPKELVYSELHFISASRPLPRQPLCMDAIIDEVSREIYALFVGVPVQAETGSVWNYSCTN